MFLVTNVDITIGEALGVSGVAMAIIMVVLGSIVGLIYLVAFVLKEMEKVKLKKAKAQPFTESEPTISEVKKELAPGSAGEIKLYNVEERDAAMIMAIVADKTGIPLNELKFISIKQTEDGGGQNEI